MRTRVLVSLTVILAALLSAGLVSARTSGKAEACRFSPSATKQLCTSTHAAPSPQVQPAATSAAEDEAQEAADTQAEATQAAAPNRRTVRTIGEVKLRPNEFIMATFRFKPERIRIASGGTATWRYADQSNEPHTATIVNKEELFKSFEDLENFEEHCPTCVQASAAHFPDPNAPPIPVVDVGEPGLDQPGDSLLFFPGEQVSAEVSAPAGTTLYYLCLIHPWMQGKIQVRHGR